MKQEITMGSLFSGSGGFELAGSIFGIRPIWASEIEPFPILVTTKNFPEMKHLGDINKLNGADLEPVTIIAGGSPFDPIPIADKATRYKGGGDTRNNDGSANGLGIGEPGAPANTLTAADRHGVACFAQQAIGEYEESEKASCLKRRDYKDSTDLILWEYIIRRLTPLECCRLQGFPDNWAEELGIPEPTQEDIDHWREVFRTQMEAMGESKKEKTDNQIRKWLKDPESDSAKYKMWGNGIALPCAMFVMEGIAMILSEEDTDEQQ